MGFPAKTVDGKTVNIVEKGNWGDTELLRADDGNVYIASQDKPTLLVPHPNNATEDKLVEAALAAEAEKQEAVATDETQPAALLGIDGSELGQIASEAGDVIDAVKDAATSVTTEATDLAEAVEEGVTNIATEAGELAGAVEEAVNDGALITPIEQFETLINESADRQAAGEAEATELAESA